MIKIIKRNRKKISNLLTRLDNSNRIRNTRRHKKQLVVIIGARRRGWWRPARLGLWRSARGRLSVSLASRIERISAMDAIDNMTPAELRTKLTEYGLPIMPITSSTRAIMAKKLKILMAANQPANSRRSLAKYSSGEDSDLEPTGGSSSKRGRRSMPPPSRPTQPTQPLASVSARVKRTPTKTTVHQVTRDSDEDSEPANNSTIKRTVRSYKTTTTTTVSKDAKDEYETGSDSEVDVVPSSASASAPLSALSPSTRSYSPLPATRPISTTYSSPSSYLNSANDLNSIRSRLGLTQTYSTSPLPSTYSYTSRLATDYKAPAEKDEIESPYLSSFTRKLSAQSAENLRNQDRTKDSDNTNGSNYVSRPYEYRRRADLSPDFKTAGEKNILKNNIVSLGIVGAVIAFFVFVSFMYMGMKSDVSFIIEDKNNVIPICSSNIPEHKASYNCVSKSELPRAMDLLKILYPELTARAIDSKCGNTEAPFMTENDVILFIKKDFGTKDGNDILKDLYNLHVLLLNNPKWGVSIIKTPTVDKVSSYIPLTSIEYVKPIRNAGQTALAIMNPSIPLKCFLSQKFHSFIILAAAIGILIAVPFTIQKLVRAYMDYTNKRNSEIYSMVEQIIDLISQENIDDGSESSGQSMPIIHVRDMLIPPQNRDKMSAIWNAAIKFIEKNESRVRFDIETIDGEEYRSLRWVSAQGSPRVTRGGAQAWQGQAFETQQGSVNNLAYSPTPCLKIRHMVDKNDKNPHLKTIIQDAILEKCGPQCKILHIDIDKVSCCVFVKCLSPTDAGIVYQNLHGWWYDGNLITVKYLRLERYMDHFPNSPSAGPYLKPSVKI